jgi:hypothetical protein
MPRAVESWTSAKAWESDRLGENHDLALSRFSFHVICIREYTEVGLFRMESGLHRPGVRTYKRIPYLVSHNTYQK